tara:strand:- start:987 stop:1220 length:234 start_codon:yes stop_codon:yes gene_type:complete
MDIIKNIMGKRYKLSLEDEKYLNILQKMNGLDLLQEQKKEQVTMGVADANEDFILYSIAEHSHKLIEAVILSRMKNN